jgi:ribose 5-phosphate isomerase A
MQVAGNSGFAMLLVVDITTFTLGSWLAQGWVTMARFLSQFCILTFILSIGLATPSSATAKRAPKMTKVSKTLSPRAPQKKRVAFCNSAKKRPSLGKTKLAPAQNTRIRARKTLWGKLAKAKTIDAHIEMQRVNVGVRAASMVESGQVVGLGTGRTANEFIKALGARVKNEKLKIVGVASSERTASLARSLGIRIVPLDSVKKIDVAIDGADEVDLNLGLVKGLGGALLREKQVASKAKRFVIMVDKEKLVTRLGQGRLPVEVRKADTAKAMQGLQKLATKATLRLNDAGKPYVTDNGNHIVDINITPQVRRTLEKPAGAKALAKRIEAVHGTIDHGLFLGMATDVLVGRGTKDVVHISHKDIK